MSEKSWFEQGYNGVDREQEKRDLGGGPKRWWMPPGVTKELVFVDDAPVCFDEHQWKTEGSKFPAFGTCLSKITQDGCPGCGSKGVQKAEYTGHLTIVDITGYKVKKNGEEVEVKYELLEFAPKLKAMNKLKIKKANKGSMIGQLYAVSRSDENAPNTGDDFDHLREAKMDGLYQVVTYRGKKLCELIDKANGSGDDAKKMRKYLSHHFQLPETGEIPAQIPVLNYQSLHAPMSVADFKRAIAGAVGFGGGGGRNSGSSGSGSGSADETVPF